MKISPGGQGAVDARIAFVRLAALEAQYREATAAHAAGHAAREERLQRELLDHTEPRLCGACGGAVWNSGNTAMCGYSLCECERPSPGERIDRRGMLRNVEAQRNQLARENDALRGHVDELTAALRALGVTRQFGLCWCRTLAGWYCVGQSHCRAAARALEGTP
jgi:hypothetical protein